MSTKIQFKKLVWWTEEDGSTLSSTGPFEFVIFKNDHQPFILEIYSIAGFQRRMTAGTMEDAQRKAQVWFEEMLIKFVETSENPAQ